MNDWTFVAQDFRKTVGETKRGDLGYADRMLATDAEMLWLIVGAPEELEFLRRAKIEPDLSLIYPDDPKQLPNELIRVSWPPKSLTAWHKSQ